MGGYGATTIGAPRLEQADNIKQHTRKYASTTRCGDDARDRPGWVYFNTVEKQGITEDSSATTNTASNTMF